MLETDETPAAIIESEGLAQISDSGALEVIVDEVLAAHPEQVAEFRSGKDQVLGFLVGQVMKASHGKANPQMANELLRERLQSGNPA
jgi:aspartyl-tRNA(Asn)/glutamyl-tRNA(Gln) amidotransferase subunit B